MALADVRTLLREALESARAGTKAVDPPSRAFNSGRASAFEEAGKLVDRAPSASGLRHRLPRNEEPWVGPRHAGKKSYLHSAYPAGLGSSTGAAAACRGSKPLAGHSDRLRWEPAGEFAQPVHSRQEIDLSIIWFAPCAILSCQSSMRSNSVMKENPNKERKRLMPALQNRLAEAVALLS